MRNTVLNERSVSPGAASQIVSICDVKSLFAAVHSKMFHFYISVDSIMVWWLLDDCEMEQLYLKTIIGWPQFPLRALYWMRLKVLNNVFFLVTWSIHHNAQLHEYAVLDPRDLRKLDICSRIMKPFS